MRRREDDDEEESRHAQRDSAMRAGRLRAAIRPAAPTPDRETHVIAVAA